MAMPPLISVEPGLAVSDIRAKMDSELMAAAKLLGGHNGGPCHYCSYERAFHARSFRLRRLFQKHVCAKDLQPKV